jgi:hypothetical protein
MIEHTKATNE